MNNSPIPSPSKTLEAIQGWNSMTLGERDQLLFDMMGTAWPTLEAQKN